jgi:exodeoxyribonuclease VII small subunit
MSEAPIKESFESWIQELENIVKKLENEDLPLDEVSRLYEKGMKVSRRCEVYLHKLEEKIITVSKEPVQTSLEEAGNGL